MANGRSEPLASELLIAALRQLGDEELLTVLSAALQGRGAVAAAFAETSVGDESFCPFEFRRVSKESAGFLSPVSSADTALYRAGILEARRASGAAAGSVGYEGLAECAPSDASEVATVVLLGGRDDLADVGVPTGSVQYAEVCGLLEEAGSPSWQPLPPLAVGRSGPIAVVSPGGYVIVAGGRGPEGQALRSVEVFDPTSREWRQGPPLTAGRVAPSAVVLDGNIFVCCGEAEDGFQLATTECVSLVAIVAGPPVEWTAGPQLRVGRYGSTAAVLAGRAYVIGGIHYKQNSSIMKAYSSVEVLSSGGSDWKPGPPLASPRCFAVAACVSGSLFVAGGSPDNFVALSTVEVLDGIPGAAWRPGPSMAVARIGPAAVVAPLPAGAAGAALLIFGGRGDRFDALSSAEALFISSSCMAPRTWRALPAFGEHGRFDAVAAVVPATCDRIGSDVFLNAPLRRDGSGFRSVQAPRRLSAPGALGGFPVGAPLLRRVYS